MSNLPIVLAAFLILITTAFLRLLYILPAIYRTRPKIRTRSTPTHLLIVLGSGGHTAEMLSCLYDLDPYTYTYRSYVIGSGDTFSALKAEEFERGLTAKVGNDEQQQQKQQKHKFQGESEGQVEKEGYSIHTVPRARHIHQPLLTTPLTSLACLLSSLRLLTTHRQGYPDLILTNGPATALIIILAATILRYVAFLPFWGWRHGVGSASSAEIPDGLKVVKESRDGEIKQEGKMRIIYVESWARVKKLSLSGRIVVACGLADRVLVQWKGLEEKGWGEYKGSLVR